MLPGIWKLPGTWRFCAVSGEEHREYLGADTNLLGSAAALCRGFAVSWLQGLLSPWAPSRRPKQRRQWRASTWPSTTLGRVRRWCSAAWISAGGSSCGRTTWPSLAATPACAATAWWTRASPASSSPYSSTGGSTAPSTPSRSRTWARKRSWPSTKRSWVTWTKSTCPGSASSALGTTRSWRRFKKGRPWIILRLTCTWLKHPSYKKGACRPRSLYLRMAFLLPFLLAKAKAPQRLMRTSCASGEKEAGSGLLASSTHSSHLSPVFLVVLTDCCTSVFFTWCYQHRHSRALLPPQEWIPDTAFLEGSLMPRKVWDTRGHSNPQNPRTVATCLGGIFNRH